MTSMTTASTTNDDLARAAMALIDERGLDALSFRKLSETTGVPTMTIVNRFKSKDDLKKAALKAMLDEIDLSDACIENWRESLRTVATKNREAALKHPGVFQLFIETPAFVEPVLSYTRRVFATHAMQDIPPELPSVFLSIMHSYQCGFQVTEGYAAKVDHSELEDDAKAIAKGFDKESFDRNLDVIIAGLAVTYNLP